MLNWKPLASVVLLVFGIAGEASAEVALQLRREDFTWKEYDADGDRLLKEDGPRYHLGAIWRTPFAEQRWLLEAQGTLYFGTVDYDGQACTLSGSCTPYQTETKYSGLQLGATMARRFGRTSGFELFAGGGIDTWKRKIDGSDTVSGATEDWTVFYAVGGAGGYWTAPTARFSVRTGLKYPLYTEELPDSYDVTLEPKGRLSLFARASMDFLAGGRPRWGFGLYYDSYRFDASDQERDDSVIVWQPESRQDVIGAFATIYFR
ncbi:MAG: hypothetical protein HY308_19010 [Gammaproteobacteria bacterium]|nr:hypothetical protein [Gammaproteobacteria bacterium]